MAKKKIEKKVKKASVKKSPSINSAKKKGSIASDSKKKSSKNTNTPIKTPKIKLRTKKVDYLTPQELEHFRDLLIEKRNEILGDMDSMEGEALRKSRNDATGDLSSMPIHMADIGTDNYEQEFALNLLDSERKILVEIDKALNRIQEGTYGICEGTGKQISKARLEANPWARYCIEYAQMVEKGLVLEGEKVYDQDEDDEDDDEIDTDSDDFEADEDEDGDYEPDSYDDDENDIISDDDNEDTEEEEDEDEEEDGRERNFSDFNSYFDDEEDIDEEDID